LIRCPGLRIVLLSPAVEIAIHHRKAIPDALLNRTTSLKMP
jgi:hypothetical protein